MPRSRRRLMFLLAAVCAGWSVVPAAVSASTVAAPTIVAVGPNQLLTGSPTGIGPLFVGNDGAMWAASTVLWRISLSGAGKSITLPHGANTSAATVGTDGRVWYYASDAGSAPVLGNVSSRGTVEQLTAPKVDGPLAGASGALVSGPGGTLTYLSTNCCSGNLRSTLVRFSIYTHKATTMPLHGPVASQGLISLAPGGGVLTTGGYVLSRTGHLQRVATFPAAYSPRTYEGRTSTAVAIGPGKTVWTITPAAITRYDRNGHASTFPLPGAATPTTWQVGIAPGPDGNLWFYREYNSIDGSMVNPDGPMQYGYITPAGQMTVENIPPLNAGKNRIDGFIAGGITAAPDGRMWLGSGENSFDRSQAAAITVPEPADGWPAAPTPHLTLSRTGRNLTIRASCTGTLGWFCHGTLTVRENGHTLASFPITQAVATPAQQRTAQLTRAGGRATLTATFTARDFLGRRSTATARTVS